MRGFTVGKWQRSSRVTTTILVVCVVFCSVSTTSAVAAASSQIVSTICGGGSTVTIAEPRSDSVVVGPTITITGTVSQSTQIEIDVDGQFDNVVPLSAGQTSYQATTQLSAGTHTLKLTAIDTCGQSNGTISDVVTVTLPPSTSSAGTATTTSLGNESASSSATGGQPVSNTSTNPLPFQPVVDGLNTILTWLNISPLDQTTPAESQLSLFRAVTIAVGCYLLIIGLAQIATAILIKSGFFTLIGLHNPRLIKLTLRGIGLLLILLALFL